MSKSPEELAEEWVSDNIGIGNMSIADEFGQYEKAYVAGYQAAQPKWIGVETPPETVGYYLALLKEPPYGSSCHKSVSYFEPTPDPWWDKDGVTHWLPLPPSPTK